MDRQNYDVAPIAALQRFTHPSAVATALAYSRRRDATDFGPELLTWHYAQDERQTAIVARFVLTVISLFSGLNAINATTTGIEYAAHDAMMRVRRLSRATVEPADVRAKQARMAKQSFLKLRNVGEAYLLKAIRRAAVRYLRACGYLQEGVYAFVREPELMSLNLKHTPAEVFADVQRIDARLTELSAEALHKGIARKLELMIARVMARQDLETLKSGNSS